MKIVFWGKEYEVIDLHSMGIDNYAFDIVSAISYMYEAVAHKNAILGGDILCFENDEYNFTCDNWYSEKIQPSETLNDALEYLKKYCAYHPNVSKWVIAITICDTY